MKDSRFDLSGKIAVVTGGTGVLGRAMLQGLLQHGATGIIIGRNQEKIQTTIGELHKAGFESDAYCADVLDEAVLLEVRKEILKKYKKIDILVNAAGGHIPEAVQQPGQSIFDIEFKNIRKTIDLNLFGTVFPTLIFGKAMLDTGSGSIVTISSMAAERSVTRVLGYSMAKAALESFTRWMAMELGLMQGDHIRINAIAPGFFLTEQNKNMLRNEDGSLTDRSKKILAHTPTGRFGKPEELISTLIWLCSDESGFVTGSVIPVDGGFSKYSGV